MFYVEVDFDFSLHDILFVMSSFDLQLLKKERQKVLYRVGQCFEVWKNKLYRMFFCGYGFLWFANNSLKSVKATKSPCLNYFGDFFFISLE